MRLGLYLLASMIVLTSACMKDHGEPIAKLSYSRLTDGPGYGYFDIHFSSNLDLDEVYSHLDSGKIGQSLICSLEKEPVFEMSHVIPVYGTALIRRDPSAPGFSYTGSIKFAETLDGGDSDTLIYRSRFRALTEGRTAIPCKMYMTAFGYKAYYSDSMYVPVAELIRFIPEK